MGTYEKCPRKYYYQYIDKPDIEMPDWPHLEFGTTAHRVLELFHEFLIHNVVPPKEWADVMRDSFKQALDESKKRGKFELIKPELSYLREIIQEYLDAVRRDGLPPVLHNELDFNFKIGEFTVRGYIDRIDKYEDGFYHVVDYKTSKNPNYLKPFQLELYALALIERYDDVQKIRGSYSLLKHKANLKTWDFTEEDLDKAQQRVLTIGTNINTEVMWKKNPTFLCNWCDFNSICQESWTADTW